MSITSLDTDLDELTLTLVADFDASIERVWELWADPRKLERWRGPPTHPATFDKHDLSGRRRSCLLHDGTRGREAPWLVEGERSRPAALARSHGWLCRRGWESERRDGHDRHDDGADGAAKAGRG